MVPSNIVVVNTLLLTMQLCTATSITESRNSTSVLNVSFRFGHSRPAKRYLPSPSCARQSETFCTQIDDYPQELVEHHIKKHSFDFKSLFLDETAQSSQTELNQDIEPETDSAENVNTTPSTETYYNMHGDWWARHLGASRRRISVKSSFRVAREDLSQTSLCPTRSVYIMPKAARNTKGEWRYVVNSQNHGQPTQLVRTERCVTSECSGLCDVPIGFTSSCSQQFVQKRLVALNADGEYLYTDTFSFPHCCICQIKPQL